MSASPRHSRGLFHRQDLPRLLFTAAITLAGGGIGILTGFPSPWLAGPMIAAAVVTIRGGELALPGPIQLAAWTMVGIAMGSGITPQIVASLPSWPATIALLAMATVVTTFASQFFFQRVCGWDRATSFFAAIPGALTSIIAVAGQTEADMRRVATAQCMRIFLLLIGLPLLIQSVEKGGPRIPPEAMMNPRDLVLVAAGTLVAALAFMRIKVPAPQLLGGLTASGLLHAAGLIHLVLPPLVVQASFAVMGLAVGMRFAGTTAAQLREIGLASLGGLTIAFASSVAFVLLAEFLVGTPLVQLLLAYAPGGPDVMSGLALTLHLDSAFVAVHQISRFMFIMAALPPAARLLRF
jgi:membrane AbrB-like protein